MIAKETKPLNKEEKFVCEMIWGGIQGRAGYYLFEPIGKIESKSNPLKGIK